MSLRGYRELLQRPHVLRLVALALAARIPIASQSLALLLLVHAARGSYASAGAVAAANGVCVGLFSPVQGRLIDRFGQTRVLAAGAVGNAALLCALTLLTLHGARLPLLLAGAAAAGASMPALSPAMQVLWPSLAGDDEHTETAFSLEAVMVELSFVCGPLLAATLSAAAAPAAAVIGAGTLTMVGTLGFAATAPSRAWRPTVTRSTSLAGALASPGIRTIVLAALPVGVALGTFEVALPAFAGDHAAPELGGLLLAAAALGSTVGGLWYGARPPDVLLSRRWVRLNVLFALGVAPLALAWNIPIMAVICTLAGSRLAPLMSASWALIARVAPSGRATDANAWYQTAMVGGTALGVAAAGAVVEDLGTDAALAAPAVALTLAACIGAARRHTLTRRWAAVTAATVPTIESATAARTATRDRRDDRLAA